MASHRVRALLTTAAVALLGAVAVSACSGGGGGGGGGGGTGPGPTTGSISGQVSAAGVGVAGAQVSIPNVSPQSTSASGGFRFDGLNPGSYSVAVQAPQGFALDAGEPASRSVTVAAGQTATVNWNVTRTGGGQNAVITTEDMRYAPNAVTIPVGGTVSFVYSAGVGHDVTPQTPVSGIGWQARPLGNASNNFSVTFTTPGTYRFRCTPHSADFNVDGRQMNGVITVQ